MAADLRIRNARIDAPASSAPHFVDLDVAGSRIIGRRPSPAATSRTADEGSSTPDGRPARILDADGRLLLPGLVNTHAHVDKSWWGKPWQSYGGEGGTEGRIRHERERRDELSIPSVATSRRVLREFLRHGTTAVRTHVDVDPGIGLAGIDAVREAAELEAPGLTLQIVAFPQDGVLRRPGVPELLRSAAAQGAEYIGGLDPAGIDRDPVGQLDLLFEIAEEHGCGIDIHLHDPGELGAFEIELVLDRTERTGLVGKVNIAHGFAIADVPATRGRDIAQRAAALGVSWSSVAPVGRPPLPLRTLRDAGVRVGLGTDGIRDLWSPYGDGDLLQIARQHARMTSQVRDEDLRAVLWEASAGARWAVGVPVPGGDGLDIGDPADLVLLPAENAPDALVRAPRRAAVIVGGSIRTPPAQDPEPWQSAD